jgi:hypothetical protein
LRYQPIKIPIVNDTDRAVRQGRNSDLVFRLWQDMPVKITDITCTACSFWDTGLNPMPPWRRVEVASDGTPPG